jgi:ketosteroid isomerase-like protein
MTDTLARNKDLVRRFMTAVETTDLEGMGACLAENAVQHHQRPSSRTDDGSEGAAPLKGRAKILDEIGTYIPQIFRPGSMRVTIENLIADGDYVGCRYAMKAVVGKTGAAYENFYYFEFRIEGGLIAEYWEYLDNQYATRMLFSP